MGPFTTVKTLTLFACREPHTQPESSSAGVNTPPYSCSYPMHYMVPQATHPAPQIANIKHNTIALLWIYRSLSLFLCLTFSLTLSHTHIFFIYPVTRINEHMYVLPCVYVCARILRPVWDLAPSCMSCARRSSIPNTCCALTHTYTHVYELTCACMHPQQTLCSCWLPGYRVAGPGARATTPTAIGGIYPCACA